MCRAGELLGGDGVEHHAGHHRGGHGEAIQGQIRVRRTAYYPGQGDTDASRLAFTIQPHLDLLPRESVAPRPFVSCRGSSCRQASQDARLIIPLILCPCLWLQAPGWEREASGDLHRRLQHAQEDVVRVALPAGPRAHPALDRLRGVRATKYRDSNICMEPGVLT
jgi:hypothetical protein